MTGSVRVSAYALRGLTARTVLRTGKRVVAPDGDLSAAALELWLGDLRYDAHNYDGFFWGRYVETTVYNGKQPRARNPERPPGRLEQK